MQSAKILIYAVHGFLGRAADWNFLKSAFPHTQIVTPDLFASEGENNFFPPQFSDFEGKKIFIGYSLGGRIGLSLLGQNPAQFDHFVFLSTNPGLLKSEESLRRARYESDVAWSEKINTKNWHQFLQEWNSQEVFKNSSIEPMRNISEYDIRKLKGFLLDWSLAKQEDFRQLISEHRDNITWVVGDRDTKFLQISEELLNKKTLSNVERVSSGHRLIFDNRDAVIQIVNKLIN